ncbi:MAG TPA: hypothetical protein VK673_15545 [Chthoniobacterales bacterium]|jgi:hypothetical protein|nr:hypothetical protein [Chthoniobacterales bacterium]
MKPGALLIFSLSLALVVGCDDEDRNDLLGGGEGSASPTPVDPSQGFCGPNGGVSALGSPTFNSGTTEVKLDLDGNPNGGAVDPDWNPETTGTINGQPVNAGTYNYVVMSQQQMLTSNASIGDWATVTNTTTGQSTFARVEDIGPKNGIGEVSQAAASAVGIQQTVVQTKQGPSTVPVGNAMVDVQVFGGTNSIQADCSQVASNS